MVIKFSFFINSRPLAVFKNTLFKVCTLTLCAVNCFAQNNKDEAKSFFQTIVKTYFDKDCDKFYSFFGDSATIISQKGVSIFSTKEMIENRKACDKFEEFTEGLNSLQDYLEAYKIFVLNKRAFTAKNNDSVLKLIAAEHTDNVFIYEILQEENQNYTDSDFLIFGNMHKSNSNKNIRKGGFWMILRKTKKGWKIFGTKA